MNGPSEKETNTQITCSVCHDPMEFDEASQMRHDNHLGYVCQECSWRLRIAVEHLKINGMDGCEYKPEPNQ